jgi:hypothetical protein
LKGTRAAHLRDGAALARFLAWLDREALQYTTVFVCRLVALQDRCVAELRDGRRFVRAN